MVQGVEELINNQESIFNNLKQICVNYKKDSSIRKNLEYLRERLSRLNALWEKFVENHQSLEELGITNIQYFTDDVFNNTKKMYEDVLQDILKRKAALPSTSTTKEVTPTPPEQGKEKSKFNFDDIHFHVPPPHETSETTMKQQDLLRQQYCNFRAFERTRNKIDVDAPMEKWQLEDSLNILKNKWEHIEKANWELDYILKDEEDTTYKQKYDAVENIYDDLRKKLQHKIWNNMHYEKATPKIEIPDFYGNYNQWLSFKDLYLESVHNNPSLSKAQKMQHLKTKLKGEAEKLVQHLGISADNYTSCWEIITHRYDNKRLLFTSYMNTLLNQPAIQQASAANIRKLHDVMLECLNGLSNIGLEITTWDPMIVHLLAQKLDSSSYNEYIKDLKEPRDFPNLGEFTKFLESKFMALETLQGNNQQKSSAPNKHYNNISPANKQYNNYNYTQRSSHFNKPITGHKTFATTAPTCPVCKKDHAIMRCDKFLGMTANARYETIRNLHICRNCFNKHEGQRCLSRNRCKLCQQPHHTLIHEAENELFNSRRNMNSTNTPSTSTSHAVNNLINAEKEVLLTTILLNVKTIDGDFIILRGLLDQGSQVSLITENAAQRLRLPRRKLSAVVSGVGSLSGNCKGSINLECKSIHSDYILNIETLIMNKLITSLPTTSFSIQNWDYIQNLKLADPHFNVSSPIDLLLGADVYSDLILNGVIKGDNNNFPVAQQTRVGWILCGNVKTFNCFVTLNYLENMSRFWESEGINETIPISNEEEYCEEFYNSTTKRQADGKYVVQMPMKPNYGASITLGATKKQAQAQFFKLEQKMLNNQELNYEYKRFMNEYISMGHMKPLPAETENQQPIYLPHHGVLKADSTTTKLRVVFNASYKTKQNNSLNDHMYSGPNLQKDMLTLLINWRTYKYVFTADIEKMYRHILLNEKQQHLQTIVWRSCKDEPLKEWQLSTVTYGMKSAPYLAMRTLRQLAQDEGNQYQEAKHALQHYFYMDDLVYGQDNIKSAKKLVSQLIELLKRGGFNLRKWTSNEPMILEDLQEDQKYEKNNINFNQEQTSTTKQSNKTLGMSWNQIDDNFTYNWNLPEKKTLTKRILLGEISKLYDPLGFLSPTTIKAKLLFQKVWISKVDWDGDLPTNITTEWESLRKDFPAVNQLLIPRWLQCKDDDIEIHGFCDASEKAYACVVYSRVKNDNGDYITTLITSKTKVAPLTKKISLPRLELCGALILAKLVEKIKTTICHKRLQLHCWSDSKVVLAWLQGDINRWDRYVSHRVAQIINIIPANRWSYVKSEENSADCATRGLSPTQLLTFQLWWEGPQWLKTYNSANKQDNSTIYLTDNELKQKCCVTTYGNSEIVSTLLSNHSSFKLITRIVGWILRIVNKMKKINNNLTRFEKEVLCSSPQEIVEATEYVIKKVQMEYFGKEIECLKKNKPITKLAPLPIKNNK